MSSVASMARLLTSVHETGMLQFKADAPIQTLLVTPPNELSIFLCCGTLVFATVRMYEEIVDRWLRGQGAMAVQCPHCKAGKASATRQQVQQHLGE